MLFVRSLNTSLIQAMCVSSYKGICKHNLVDLCDACYYVGLGIHLNPLYSIVNFDCMRNDRDFKPRGGRGGGRFDRRDSSDRPQMFQAICANCGNDCEVPFKPSGERPVYCNNCFDKQGDRDSRFGGDRDRGGRSSRFEDKRMFPATCDNCGNACEVPFKPSGDKPIYCRDCFNKMGKGNSRPHTSSGGNDAMVDQFAALNKKLDAILSVLSPKQANTTSVKPVEKKADKKIVVEDKKAAKKGKAKKAKK